MDSSTSPTDSQLPQLNDIHIISIPILLGLFLFYLSLGSNKDKLHLSKEKQSQSMSKFTAIEEEVQYARNALSNARSELKSFKQYTLSYSNDGSYLSDPEKEKFTHLNQQVENRAAELIGFLGLLKN